MNNFDLYNSYKAACEKHDIIHLTFREWQNNGRPTFEQYASEGNRNKQRKYRAKLRLVK